MHAHTVRQSLHVTRRSVVALAVAIVMAASVFLATPGTADAGHVTCGQVITTDTTLDSDVGPCNGTDGIVVGANGITLDLNGHSVIGDPNLDGEGAVGIVLQNRESVTVTSSQAGGTVRDFDAGVTLTQESRNNTVRDVVVRDNIGNSSLSDFGDGIAIFNSSDNLIENNVVDHNGPFDGIGVVQFGEGTSATGNQIVGNEVVNNDIPSSATTNQDDGIRLEPGTTNTTVAGNTVHDNGLDGIALFADSTDNTVHADNDVRGNGFHDKPHRRGDGVRVFGRPDNPRVTNNEISANEVFGNAANGVRVDSRSNDILNNKTGGNAEAPTASQEIGPLTVTVDVRVRLQLAGEELQEPAPAFDLHDGNTDSEGSPSCDDNTWSGNTFDTAFPDCTKG